MKKHLFLKNSLKIMAIILWFLAALAWNEVAKSSIDNFATIDSILFFKLIYFFVMLIFAIIAVYYFARLIQNTRD